MPSILPSSRTFPSVTFLLYSAIIIELYLSLSSALIKSKALTALYFPFQPFLSHPYFV